MALDRRAKRAALRMIPYALFIVTSRHKDEVTAFTGTWLTQTSFDPPLVAIACQKDSTTYPLIKAGGLFSIQFLRKDQRAVAKAFFKPAEVADGKLSGYPFSESAIGLPVLDAALAYVECKVAASSDVGDHEVFIGEVVDAVVREEGPNLLLGDTPWHYGG
jgi:flavin reductase (DIM6/NTAB) family NADH-FMN oxidoreductase RutF